MNKLEEPKLPDDYPVYWDYIYVCDGKIHKSDMKGTVRDLKIQGGFKEVRRCDIFGRCEGDD